MGSPLPKDTRRQTTGASKKKTTAAKATPIEFSELGISTVPEKREQIARLASRGSAVATYTEMMDTDVSCDVSVRAVKTPAQNGDYFIEPFDEQQENLDIAKFIDFNIFHGMTTPWGHVLGDILTMMENGFAILEEVLELREYSPDRGGANRRKFTMLRKLALRPASTITEFVYDENGGPVSVKQQVVTGTTSKEVEIPIAKLMIFTFNKRGGNLEGRSILRPAVKHWTFKEGMYRIDAVQKERHGIGIPDVELLPGHTDADKKFAIEMARNLRSNERAYVVRPPTIGIKFLKPEGNLIDALTSAEHHDGMIMKNTMVQFLNMGLGITGGGGRATSSSQLDMFTKSVRSLANLVCDYFNLFLIPRLVAYNFPTDKFPKMNVRGLGETKDLQQFASALANLAARGLITIDDETEQWVRRNFDMPLFKGKRPAPVAPTQQAPTAGNGNGNGNSPDKGDVTKAIQSGNIEKGTNPN